MLSNCYMQVPDSSYVACYRSIVADLETNIDDNAVVILSEPAKVNVYHRIDLQTIAIDGTTVYQPCMNFGVTSIASRFT